MIVGYFGLPGSGKTTFLTRIAQKELRRIAKGKSKYERVYTNFYCQGCYKIDFKNLGVYNVENALVLLDEITLDADSRDFKSFAHHTKSFFLLHRHYNCDVIYFTQQWNNVDKKIRDVTSDLFYVTKSFANVKGFIFKPFQCFSVARRVFRTLEINEYTKEIVNGYRFPTMFERFFGSCKQFCYRPSWYRFFDSWEKSESLSEYDFCKWDTVENLA